MGVTTDAVYINVSDLTMGVTTDIYLCLPTEGLSHGKGPPQSYNESGYHSFAEATLDPNSFEARQNALNSPHASPRRGGEEDGNLSSNQRWAQIKKQQQYKDQERFEPEPASNHRPAGPDGLSPRMAQFREEGQGSPRMSQVGVSCDNVTGERVGRNLVLLYFTGQLDSNAISRNKQTKTITAEIASYL